MFFFFFTFRDDEVIAAASLNYDPAVSAVAQRLVAGKVITKEEAEYVKSVFMLLSSERQMSGSVYRDVESFNLQWTNKGEQSLL